MDPAELALPWTESPCFEDLLEKSDLDEALRAEISFFAEHGYLILDLAGPDFERLARAIVDRCGRDVRYQTRWMDAWSVVPEVQRLATWPAVLELLERLYRRAPIPMQTLNFGRGTEQPPHADDFHFSSVPRGFMCGVWIALEDVDRDNGPLEYYPGSHRLPYVDHATWGLSGSRRHPDQLGARYEAYVSRVIEAARLERRLLTVRAGQAIVWAANLLHGGSPIRDPARTRHSQVTHYYFEDCAYYQPQRSDWPLGRIEWLDKRDVRTGRPIPHVYNGVPLDPALTASQRLRRWGRSLRFHAERIGLSRGGRSSRAG